MTDQIRVEVVLADPAGVQARQLSLAAPVTVKDAVEQSGLLDSVGTRTSLSYGIFSRKCDPAKTVSDGDRVEIYWPLAGDPNERRRSRAK